MSVENQEHPYPEPPHETLARAVEYFDRANLTFFEAASDWARLPVSRRLPILDQRCDEAGQAFQNVVFTMMRAPDLSIEERASQVATFFQGADSTRVAVYKMLAPQADFIEYSDTHEKLISTILDDYNDSESLDVACISVVAKYAASLKVDNDNLLAAVESSGRARMLRIVNRLGGEALDVGKMSAAVVVGSLLARQVMKRSPASD